MANGNDQYDVRQAEQGRRITLDPAQMETAMEIMGLSPDLMRAAFEGAGETYDRQFGEPEQFSEEDRRALSVLQAREQRLQPTETPAPIQGLLPGNPYAVNFRGLSQGLQNLVGSLVNKEKADQLYGDPEKRQTLMARSQNKLQKAKELRQTANSLMGTQGDLPGFPGTQEAAEQMLSDAEALEEAAARDAEAAEKSRGVLSRAKELEEQQAEAETEQEQREDFIRKYGSETYKQALQAERESREQKALTERETIRQQALNDRAQANIKYGIRKAQINARAKVQSSEADAGGFPTYAQPEYVKEFVPEYMGPIEDRLDELQNQLFYDDGTPIGTADPGLQQEFQTLRRHQQILREINLDAITYGQLKDDGVKADQLPETRSPSAEERQLIMWMNATGMPQEMIDAYKFYNRISLNKAPQGPETQRGSDPGDLSPAFRPSGFGTGEWLMRDQGSNNQENE